MDLADLLQQFGGNVTAQAPQDMDVEGHFDQVANSVPKEDLASGLAEAFRSDQTPPFASMLGGLFGNSGGSQQASVVNELLAVAGPMIMQRMMGGGGGQQAAAAAGGGGGAFGDILGAVMGSMSGGGGGGGGATAGGGGALTGILGQMMGEGGQVRQLTAEEASQISPEEIQALAEEAHKHDPSIVDRLSGIYAEHPTLIKTLGAGALALAMSKIAHSRQQ